MGLSDGLAPKSVVHSVDVDSRVRGSGNRHVTHPGHTTHPNVADVGVHARLRHAHRVKLGSLHVVHSRSRSVRLLVRLMLRGDALGRVLDLLVGLLLWRLLGSGTSGTGRGGREVTLGVLVVALVHNRVFAIPFLKRNQHAHIQLREELGGWTRVRGRELLREVKQLQEIVPCTRLMNLRREIDD